MIKFEQVKQGTILFDPGAPAPDWEPRAYGIVLEVKQEVVKMMEFLEGDAAHEWFYQTREISKDGWPTETQRMKIVPGSKFFDTLFEDIKWLEKF
jgi:hypothetical protein